MVAAAVAERFWSKVTEQPNGCWTWRTEKRPYFWYNGKGVPAYRVSYTWMVGEIPDGLDLDHLCRIESCVNPYHLDPVPRRVNVQRAPTGGMPAINRAKTHCKRGHLLDGENLYIFPATGYRRCRKCLEA